MSSVQEAPDTGQIPYAIGQASVVRIPIPRTGGLCIEFRARGKIPASGSTSTLFFQDTTGRRHLRLDYGYNVKSKTIDYHWNQKGTHQQFAIADHTTTGKLGRAGYQGTKYFRHAGRVLLIAGVAIDIVSIVWASKPIRRASEVVVAWAGAWVGCESVGAGGAAIGTAAAPGPGTAIGGVTGCIIGGIGGYWSGSVIGGMVYDWTEDTVFFQIPQVSTP